MAERLLDGVWVVTGGNDAGRSFLDNNFEHDVISLLGDDIAQSPVFAAECWCAIANVRWQQQAGLLPILYSYRAAGDLIAAIRGEGDYLDWYCAGRPGFVSVEITKRMALRGWRASTN